MDNEPQITHFSPGCRLVNDGLVPLLTVYFDDNNIVNYVSSLEFWRATYQEIVALFTDMHTLPTTDRTARWIIRKLKMQPEGNSIVM